MDKERQINWNIEGSSSKNLLRIGVVFLAIVSFFTTANGMKEYIFVNNSVIAYSASAAIQGILLALSMNLPGYLLEICKRSGQKPGEKLDLGGVVRKAGRFIRKFILCTCAIILTIVTIFCSSWFSYVYIADTIHKDSWGIDSELLVQQTYRTELYNARDYIYTYRIYLEESLGENILLLEDQAKQLSETTIENEIDWVSEREIYVSDTGKTAGSYMSIVINAMQNVFEENDSQQNRDIAVTAVADAKTNITNRKEDIQQELNLLNGYIDNYNNQIANLTNRINRATEGTDTTALTDSVNNYSQLITQTTERQATLQTEYMELDFAMQRLPYYESQLGLSSSTSSISIRSNLMQLQSEIFQQEPNVDRMLEIANTIYDNLRNASTTISGNENGTTQESFTYTNMLVQMNRLIRNLTDYSEAKVIEANLEGFITDLRSVERTPMEQNASMTLLESPEPTDESGSSESEESREPISSEAPEESGEPIESEESSGTEEPTESEEPSETSAPEESATLDSEPNDTPSKRDDAKNEQWKSEWNTRLAMLKAQVSAMPVYSGSEEGKDGTASVLSQAQLNILHNYDRNETGKRLDDMIRRYISTHNAIYQGIIYLQSPYRSLALFALILAFSFDLSGFIFGFVMQGDNEEHSDNNNDESSDPNKKKKSVAGKEEDLATDNDENLVNNKVGGSPNEKNNQIKVGNLKLKAGVLKLILGPSAVSSPDANTQAEWSIIKTMKPYIVLTGDYESKDGVYYYNSFKDGLLYRWAVKDAMPYGQGVYIQHKVDDKWARGEQQNPEKDQRILFANQEGGPQDGIYKNCQLIFDEGSLILDRNDQHTFIASVDEYVPVHSYSPSQGKNRTIPAKQLVEKKVHKVKIAVVALSDRGTRISAIYMIEDEK